uniref:Uncharacterized protein n=1 Tax=Arion vulgaris TaxID=1028688 RepID=A0A0B6Y7Z5_9EUPU
MLQPHQNKVDLMWLKRAVNKLREKVTNTLFKGNKEKVERQLHLLIQSLIFV